MSCSTITSAVPSRGQRGQRVVDGLDHDRRQAERDLVAQQQPRVAPSARGRWPTICCSPPESAGARRVAGASPSIGKARRCASRVHGPAARVGADQQVLLDARGWETAAGLRAPGRCPGAERSCAGRPPTGWPVEAHASARRPGRGPAIDLQERGLAGAVGADHRDDLSCRPPRSRCRTAPGSRRRRRSGRGREQRTHTLDPHVDALHLAAADHRRAARRRRSRGRNRAPRAGRPPPAARARRARSRRW